MAASKRDKRYLVTTGQIALGTTAADTCIYSLKNPGSQLVEIILRKMQILCLFQGTSAATGQSFGISRNTGTAAGGSATKATTGIGKSDTAMGNSIVEVRVGPTAITGLTADTPADLYLVHLTHQVTNMAIYDLISDMAKASEKDPQFVILPGITLGIRTRVAASVAGAIMIVNAEWEEV